ncbi:MAG: hypothetical protein A4E35_01191 [Methanoregula sp. PtaU1.Bin051]|nr:MAG: hypothetical protein A4E35_01191 [Methanoregula sp. PtaU1.Bin051]
MQLPRGKFRSIKKGVRLREILDDSRSSRLTCTCSFSSGPIHGILVFEEGVCILAKVQDRYGIPGWKEACSLADQVMDIAISDLDTAQIQLALEFNKKAYTGQRGRPPADRSEESRTGQKRHRERENDFIKITPARPIVSAQKSPLDQELISIDKDRESVTPRKEPGSTVARDSAGTHDDFDVFDETDLDDIERKMRKDCKTILKHLQLDHLTEK